MFLTSKKIDIAMHNAHATMQHATCLLKCPFNLALTFLLLKIWMAHLVLQASQENVRGKENNLLSTIYTINNQQSMLV